MLGNDNKTTDQSNNNNSVVEEKTQADKLYSKPEDSVETPAENKTKTDETVVDQSLKKEDQPPQESVKDEKPAENKENKPEDKPEEKVEYVIPELLKDSKVVVDEVLEFAKANKLSKEQTQVLLDREASIADNQMKSQNALIEKRKSEWAEASKKDPEFGGENFESNLKIAEQGFSVAPKTIQDYLKNTGMVNHPDVIRFFLKIGKSGMSDRLVPAGNEAGEKPKSAAERLYGKAN